MNTWNDLHQNYQKQDWVEKPSLFAESVLPYFPKSGKVLELGAGLGQDSIYFAKQGYDVVSTDIEINSLEKNLFNQNDEIRKKIKAIHIDLTGPFPFEENSFEVVYAHLSLHYFDLDTTIKIINAIMRILKPGGTFAFLTNSVDDPEYNTGDRIEKDFFKIDKVTKRYFTTYSVYELTKGFEIDSLDNLGRTYKDEAKGITRLIRFIGHKKAKDEV
jgi:SAM-dependent methyltransferase